MSDNPYLDAISSSDKTGNPYINAISGSGDEWSQANVGDPIRKAEAVDPNEGFLSRQERMRKKRLNDLTKDGLLRGVGRMIGNTPVDPFSMVGNALVSARETFTDKELPFEEYVPEGSVASMVKGAVDLPQGIGQRFWNVVAPGSAEANASNQISTGIDRAYRENFRPSEYGEAIGNMVPTIGLPVPKALGALKGGKRILASALTGAGTGAVLSQGRPIVDAESSESVAEQSKRDALLGAILGGGAPIALEASGAIGRKLSPQLQSIKDFIKKKRLQISGQEPHEALVEDLGQMSKRSSEYGGGLYEEVKSKYGDEITDPTPLINQLSLYVDELKTKTPKDTVLIGKYEEMINDLSAKAGKPSGLLDYSGNPIPGKTGVPEATPSISNMQETSRNIGGAIQQARNTGGQVVQKTRTAEEKSQLERVKEIIGEMISKKNPEAGAGYAEANRFWHEGGMGSDGGFYPAPAKFTDTAELGGLISALRGSPKQDVLVSNLGKSKSTQFANKVGEGTSSKGKTAIQVNLLEQAEKAGTGMHPDKWYEQLIDKNGDIHPMAKMAFTGDDLEALKGFIKLKKFANVMAKGTNLGGGLAVGSAFGPAGSAAGVSLPAALLWMRRGSWVNSWSAPMWEKLVNNPATRGALATMAKAPPASPGFSKAFATINEAFGGEE